LTKPTNGVFDEAVARPLSSSNEEDADGGKPNGDGDDDKPNDNGDDGGGGVRSVPGQ